MPQGKEMKPCHCPLCNAEMAQSVNTKRYICTKCMIEFLEEDVLNICGGR